MAISENWTRENIAWAAGLFEGEGCITKNGTAIRLTLGMTDLDVVQRFHRVAGVGAIEDKPSMSQWGKKPYWTWAVYRSEHVQALLAAFWPFLGERRKAKAKELLKRWASVSPRASKKRFCKRGHEFTEQNTYRSGGARQCRQCRNMHMGLLRERTKTNGDHDIRRVANRLQ